MEIDLNYRLNDYVCIDTPEIKYLMEPNYKLSLSLRVYRMCVCVCALGIELGVRFLINALQCSISYFT